MTSAARLRTSMSEVVKTEPQQRNGRTFWLLTLSCGHVKLVREKTRRAERRCSVCCPKARAHG